ncbi:MAG: imidazole glycerol phosphate synthase subunit HisF [Rhizobiales bacterium]|nr:imidazole glycerol phosphate synthase subunit HisF [Hyphomicrobiales bacterium]
MRVIARLDVKNEWVIKGIQMEGLRKVGAPIELAQAYYEAGVHELIFMDAVASLYDRNNLFHIIERACKNVFIPISIGGGLRTIEDVSDALLAGADKVAINTGAVNNLSLVSEVANRFGSQCIMGSIEAKRQADGSWQAYIDSGREPTGLNVLDWVQKLEAAGVGEILLTSVDQDGTRRGFDLGLLASVNSATSRPVILSGGYGEPKHLVALQGTGPLPSAIAVASVLHYNQASTSELIELAADLTSTAMAA